MVDYGLPTVFRNPDVMPRLCKSCSVGVETGTQNGRGARAAAKWFDVLFTVEISRGYTYKFAGRLRNARPNIVTISGDSGQVVPYLARCIHEPVLWYLDAHTRKGEHVDKFPLWRELDAINNRTQPDVVIVDDIHAFGRDDDWGKTISQDSLREAFSRHCATEVYNYEFIMHTTKDTCPS